ncbi:DUF6090 family protein [Aquimarina spongiae]|uniref:Uncharacterized protein n=1 Tax=Aquimarina spongiae TaxID=570521 RepID=A0A1M6HP94_9FLAO|nr:DUF6090 family protein [Aquimarina spongiae]SHJ24015.1 hypothetical protein SAMN04488508_106388 [Aquimarina spongiae]
MIKFFRKVRQKLLSENKFGKYLKYGLGEIFLVVIGILIAVYINNLNIKQQNEEKEILYLTRLTTNLGSDKELYGSIMSKDSLLIDKLNQVNKNLPNYIKSITDNVKDFNFLTTGYKFNANTTVIDNLISSGQIELLRSNYLVEDILVYYRQTEHVEETIDAAIISQNTETVNNLILKFSSKSKTDKYYHETLKNYINFRINLIEKQIKSYGSQKIRTERLIDQINEEINLIETVY